MEGFVYLLCAATALTCGLLLLRGYRKSRTRLLLWCGLCFVILFAENAVLFVDLVIVPHIDLMLLRRCLSLAAVSLLLFGLIWDTPRR
ncbi:MAG: DUF5985 family protein [Planctomycetes bacterium]|nr:DUF5985 family protein [Planctomycetota bacterium]